MTAELSSFERVITALGQKEPDRVPLLLLFSFYAAKELKIGVKDYFDNPENVVEAQVKLQKKYKTDCYYGFYYASAETEAFGSKSIFFNDGPPNAGAPIIKRSEDINSLKCPEIADSPVLNRILKTLTLLKKEASGKIPVIGVVMSPFSLPVMQMGFSKYLDLMIYEKELFWKLMKINEEFAEKWANAQVEAGADCICYFDPISSPSITPVELYKKTGFEIACRTIGKIKAQTATHMASGKVLPIIDYLAETKTAIVGLSSTENINEVKNKCRARMSVLGNLNGIEMCRWDAATAEKEVKNIIYSAGKGGGLLISDNHGEIPYYVNEKVLKAISEAVEKFGNYPIIEK